MRRPRRFGPGATAPAAGHRAHDVRGAALDATADAVLIFDAGGALIYSNPAARQLHGYDDGRELAGVGRSELATFFARREVHRIRERLVQRIARWGWWRGEMEARTAEGWPIPVEVSITAMQDGSLVFVTREISQRRLREQALRSREELFRLVARNSTDVVGLHEADGSFLYLSPSVERILGYDQYELLGTSPGALVHPSHRERVERAYARAADGEPARVSYRVRTRGGTFIWFETLVRAVEEFGAPHLQSSSRDISERKRFERQLAFRALHDPLTSLPNRALFISQLERALSLAQREGTRVGVVFVDLDRFKQINDTLGHAAGDTALVRTAQQLVASVRESDTVARLGGDEFAILMHRVEPGQNAGILVDRIRAAFPLKIGPDLIVRTSVGLALSPPGGEPVERLLARADEAMYAEKGAGRRRAGATPAHPPERSASGGLVGALAEALSSGQGLSLRYQPIVELRSGDVTAVEALLRWTTPWGRVISPAEVLALTRQAGLAPELTRWVAREACRRMRVWGGQGLSPSHVSINVSKDEISSPGFGESISTAIEAAGIAPCEFSIEVPVRALERGAGRLRAVASTGVRLVVEQLETAAPRETLGRVPASSVKVDRALVRRLGSADGRAVVRAVVEMGEDMGFGVGAVGIETRVQMEDLARLGFATGQGFLLGRPQGALFLEALLAGGEPALEPGARDESPTGGWSAN